MIIYIPFFLAIWKFKAIFSLSPSVLFFHKKDTQQDLSYYRCLSGQYFMPNEKQLNIILHHRPTAMLTVFSAAPCQNNIFPLSFQFSPVHPTFLLHFQTRTLCSAMRRQMAIQLFIARMGSWIWQDIHARKLCKRVRTNHRTDSTYLTLEYSFVCIVPIFIQLPTKRKYPKLRHQIPPYTKQAAHVISFTDRIRRRSTSSKSRKVSPIRWNWSWRLFSTRRKVSPPPNCRCAGMLRELFSICLVFN